MNRNMKFFKEQINHLKSVSALTIIEVLVAVILTAIVMVNGTTFFIASWKLGMESKDYNMVLNETVSNLEKFISKDYNNSVTISSTKDYVVYRRSLRRTRDRNSCTVEYKIQKDTSPWNRFGFYYVISSARWRYGGESDSDNVINIKTACANRWLY